MKTTNSARLLPLMTQQAEVRDCGERGAPVDCSDLERDGRTFLLFPDGSGVEATKEWAESLPGPLRLVVPDGNWTQARHITQRVAPLMRLPRVQVRAVGADPLYTVRRTPHEGGLCTLSAVARVLGIVEGDAVRQTMEEALKSLVTAVQHARQRPPGYREHDASTAR